MHVITVHALPNDDSLLAMHRQFFTKRSLELFVHIWGWTRSPSRCQAFCGAIGVFAAYSLRVVSHSRTHKMEARALALSFVANNREVFSLPRRDFASHGQSPTGFPIKSLVSIAIFIAVQGGRQYVHRIRQCPEATKTLRSDRRWDPCSPANAIAMPAVAPQTCVPTATIDGPGS